MSGPPDRFERWLEAMHPTRGPLVAGVLADLPGLAVYEGPPPASREGEAFAAAEFSAREGAPGLRLSWSLDPRRAAPGAIERALRAFGADPTPVAGHTGHVLVGVDWADSAAAPRAKLYVYPQRGRTFAGDFPFAAAAPSDPTSGDPSAPEGTAGAGLPDAAPRSSAVAGASFVAVDLNPGAPSAIKLYFEHATREGAVAALPPALQDVARALPEPIPGTRAPFVVTRRIGPDGPLDVTLHAKPGRAAIDPLIGPELAAMRATLTARALEWGLTLRPTYVSWLVSLTGPRRARTLYWQLRGPR